MKNFLFRSPGSNSTVFTFHRTKYKHGSPVKANDDPFSMFVVWFYSMCCSSRSILIFRFKSIDWKMWYNCSGRPFHMIVPCPMVTGQTWTLMAEKFNPYTRRSTKRYRNRAYGALAALLLNTYHSYILSQHGKGPSNDTWHNGCEFERLQISCLRYDGYTDYWGVIKHFDTPSHEVPSFAWWPWRPFYDMRQSKLGNA